jgi:hypothetical protein
MADKAQWFAGTREAAGGLRDTAKATYQQLGQRLSGGTARVTGLFDGAGVRVTNAASSVMRFAGNHPLKLAAGLGIAGWLKIRSDRKAQAAEDAAAAMQLGYAPMGGGMQSYKNTVNPEEAALLNARQRDGGANGFAAGLAAQREAAVQAASGVPKA